MTHLSLGNELVAGEHLSLLFTEVIDNRLVEASRTKDTRNLPLDGLLALLSNRGSLGSLRRCLSILSGCSRRLLVLLALHR